jgi:hypothetical protein
MNARADLYAGQAGVLEFLAAAYRVRPEDELRTTLLDGARWLRVSRPSGTRGLFDGRRRPRMGFPERARRPRRRHHRRVAYRSGR